MSDLYASCMIYVSAHLDQLVGNADGMERTEKKGNRLFQNAAA